MSKICQYAILNDIHFPYESRSYYAALKQMKSWPNLKHIYLNGDILEIESVSSHPKSPTAQRMLLAELDYGNARFDELSKMFPDVPVTYLEGNHEHRIFRYIRDIAPEMWGIANVPSLLKFDERRNWKLVEYGPTQLCKVGLTSDLYIRHEPLAGGQMHSKGTSEKSIVSLIYGHVHTYQLFQHKKFGPKPYLVTAMSNGWLGDIKKACFDYRGARDNWQLGFTRVNCNEGTGDYAFRFIPLG